MNCWSLLASSLSPRSMKDPVSRVKQKLRDHPTSSWEPQTEHNLSQTLLWHNITQSIWVYINCNSTKKDKSIFKLRTLIFFSKLVLTSTRWHRARVCVNVTSCRSQEPKKEEMLKQVSQGNHTGGQNLNRWGDHPWEKRGTRDKRAKEDTEGWWAVIVIGIVTEGGD